MTSDIVAARVRASWRGLLLVMLTALAAGAVVALVEPRVYTASAVLQFPDDASAGRYEARIKADLLPDGILEHAVVVRAPGRRVREFLGVTLRGHDPAVHAERDRLIAWLASEVAPAPLGVSKRDTLAGPLPRRWGVLIAGMGLSTFAVLVVALWTSPWWPGTPPGDGGVVPQPRAAR